MGLFERTKKWLRKTYPVPFAVRIYTLEPRSKQMKGAAGWFLVQDGTHALIYIARGDECHMAETLIEEWSHALRHAMPLTVDYEGEAHDEHFWVTYGRITNAWRKRFFA